jgi:5-methylcytosine-specific restriction endonuclease McrA
VTEQHPPCTDCGGPSIGDTAHGPMCLACAQKRQHAARCVPCAVRYTRVCDVWSTGVDEAGEPICNGCTRKRQRLAQPPAKRLGGSRGAPRPVRKRVLERDGHQCQLRYEGVCTGHADEVDHVINVASVLRTGGTREQADDPINLTSSCGPCHSVKTAREQREGSAATNQQRAQARRKRLRLPQQKHPGDH